jgi:hypothetical protein
MTGKWGFGVILLGLAGLALLFMLRRKARPGGGSSEEPHPDGPEKLTP